MNHRRILSTAIVTAILAVAILGSFLPEASTAAPPMEDLYGNIVQPPPPPPGSVPNQPGNTEPPDGSGNAPAQPAQTGNQPPMPATVPVAGQPLPDPNAKMVAPAGASVGTFAITTDELEVLADRGCPSQYQLNDPIQFIARRGNSQANGYWSYMEIWNSTNGAWWTKLAADWVAPGGSLNRSGRIAQPVGQEQLYSRLIDQYGNVIEEAWCEYTSNAAPVVPTIKCGQTIVENLALNEEHRYSFYGVGGRQVRINMTGMNGLDTYIELLAPDGTLIASNDDINVPYDLNSRMQVWLPVSGTYTVVARGFKRQAGQYSLSVGCN